MTYAIFLVLHIVGACVTGLVALYAGAALWQGREAGYRGSATALGLLAGFEVLSGVMLSMLSVEVSALSLCANIALYLSVIALFEVLLFARIQKTSLAFPTRLALSPSVASLALLLVAISFGF